MNAATPIPRYHVEQAPTMLAKLMAQGLTGAQAIKAMTLHAKLERGQIRVQRTAGGRDGFKAKPAAILHYIREHAGCTAADISAALHIDKDVVRNRLVTMLRDGRVTRDRVPGCRYGTHVYFVAPKKPKNLIGADRLNEICAYIAAHPHSTRDEIAAGVGVAKRTGTRYMTELLRLGRVTAERSHRSHPYRYQVAL